MCQAVRLDDAYESPVLKARFGQAFPTLGDSELERVRAFATPCELAAGTRVYETGKSNAGIYEVLSGSIRITARLANSSSS